MAMETTRTPNSDDGAACGVLRLSLPVSPQGRLKMDRWVLVLACFGCSVVSPSLLPSGRLAEVKKVYFGRYCILEPTTKHVQTNSGVSILVS